MNFFAFHVIPSVFRPFFTIWSPYMWDRADKMSIVLNHCKAGPFVSHLFAHRSLGSACGRLSSLCRTAASTSASDAWKRQRSSPPAWKRPNPRRGTRGGTNSAMKLLFVEMCVDYEQHSQDAIVRACMDAM